MTVALLRPALTGGAFLFEAGYGSPGVTKQRMVMIARCCITGATVAQTTARPVGLLVRRIVSRGIGTQRPATSAS
jgi:hypothetical protein